MDNVIIINKISPDYDSSKLQQPTFENKVDVFEDRMKGWMMDWAEYLNKQEHAGFAVLHIGISYFESIAIWIKGESSKYKSESFFKYGFKEVFSNELTGKDEAFIEQFAAIIYKQGRCGFYHSGMAKKEVGLRDGELFMFKKENDKVKSIWIDRYKFIEAIIKHFDNYVVRLRNIKEMELRNNFLKAWDIFHSE